MDVFDVEPDKEPIKRTVLLGDIANSFNEEKSKFFIIGPNSSSENPGRDKQDFTVVEQYLLAPMLLEKKLTDRSLDIIMYIVGHTSQIFSDAKSQHFLRRDMQVI